MYKTCSPVMHQLRVRTAGASFSIVMVVHMYAASVELSLSEIKDHLQAIEGLVCSCVCVLVF